MLHPEDVEASNLRAARFVVAAVDLACVVLRSQITMKVDQTDQCDRQQQKRL